MPMNNLAGPVAGLWPEEHTQELIRLAGEKLSYRAIALALNEKFGTVYTKNATIGKAARLGLAKESAPSVPGNCKPKADRKAPYKIRTPRQRIEATRIVPANGNSNAMRIIKTVTFEMEKLRCAEIVPRNVSLLELEPNDCRYPTAETDQHLFCGHAKMAGSSYCAPHHALSTEAPRVPIHRFVGIAA
jgi:GcrA cell cycle regulator